jgi:organic radical activating enzyme
MSRTIAVEHSDASRSSIVVVDWFVGNTCNYACTYCPKPLHDGSSPWLSGKVVSAFCRRLVAHYETLKKRVYVQFTGGEATLWRDFVTVSRTLKSMGCLVGLISNGSRSVAFWLQVAEFIDIANLTYHLESASLDHFISITKALSAKTRTHINVPMLPDRFDECLAAAKSIAECCSDVTLTVKPLLLDFGPKLFPYSSSQMAVLREFSFAIRDTRPLLSIRGSMKCISDDGSTSVKTASQLLVECANQWAGWTCYAGVEMLSIDAKGIVFRGLCRVGGAIGNIFDPVTQPPNGPIVCTRERCSCLADIMTTRHAPRKSVGSLDACGLW